MGKPNGYWLTRTFA